MTLIVLCLQPFRLLASMNNAPLIKNKRLAFGVLLMIATSAYTPTPATISPIAVLKEPCSGYSIIEFGKGVDCHGDTILLTRKNGLQMFIAKNNQ